MNRFPAAALAGLVACATGCSSSYIPHPGPRVSILMSGGTIAYARDGKTYEGGLFGGDIEEAVRGNAEAEGFAHDYKTGMVTGFVTTMLGVAGMVGGLAVTGLEETPPASNQSVPVLGPVIMGAGILAYAIGLVVMLNAAPHLYDAVNAYNDGLAPPAP